MTAEIAIMNKSAVALAADSKVTIGASGAKTFDTVNKVFTLSKLHPVGLMIFGNAEFMRYPWETIVKIYRSQKGPSSHSTILDWGDDFINFIRRFGDIRAADKHDNCESIVSSAFQDVRDDVRKAARRLNVSVTSPDYTRLVGECLEHVTANHTGTRKIFSDAYMNTVKRQFASTLETVANSYFGGFGRPIVRKAKAYAEQLIQNDELSPISSGIVIAGFGDDDILPALVRFDTDGYIGARAKIVKGPPTIVARDNASAIIPFAQKDMVYRFMEGIDPEYDGFINARFSSMLAANCLHVLDKYGSVQNKNKSVRSAITDAARKSMNDHRARTAKFRRDTFSMPIVRMVAMLPKDELPHLAESLVALTSLKRHVSNDAETVGGPIDVALISKGDGFIWIKRKHYFRAELNPHFAANYRREIDEGNANGTLNRKTGRATKRPTGRRAITR